MRSSITFLVLLVGFTVTGWVARAQSTEPASTSGGSNSVSATKEEVNELRSELAAQRKTIEELKALVEKLAQEKGRAAEGSAHVPGIIPAFSNSLNNISTVNVTAINDAVVIASVTCPLESFELCKPVLLGLLSCARRNQAKTAAQCTSVVSA